MATATLIDSVKLDLRFSHDNLNDDVSDTIDSCKADLKLAGVNNISENDSLIVRAIKLYCRWMYDYNNKGELYCEHYKKLKQSLSLSGDYNVQ